MVQNRQFISTGGWGRNDEQKRYKHCQNFNAAWSSLTLTLLLIYPHTGSYCGENNRPAELSAESVTDCVILPSWNRRTTCVSGLPAIGRCRIQVDRWDYLCIRQRKTTLQIMYCTNFCLHPPQHHNTIILDLAGTHSSYRNTILVYQTLTFSLECFTKIVTNCY